MLGFFPADALPDFTAAVAVHVGILTSMVYEHPTDNGINTPKDW